RGRGAWVAGADGLAPAVPRPGPCDPDHRRRHGRAARDPAPGRRRPAGGGAPRRSLWRAVAVVRGAAGGALGRRAGRRADVRLSDRDPRGDERRRDDRRLGAPSLRPRGDSLSADRERDPGREPRGTRRDVEAARDDRVGVVADLVTRLASASIGETYNQYAASPLLCDRLRAYLEAQSDAKIVLVGEAAGYRGARVSGIPFTSERQLTGSGPAEATATIVHRVLAGLGVEDEVLLWNVVPTHPGTRTSNRRPTRAEVEAGSPFIHELMGGRTVIAVGRLAAGVL